MKEITIIPLCSLSLVFGPFATKLSLTIDVSEGEVALETGFIAGLYRPKTTVDVVTDGGERNLDKLNLLDRRVESWLIESYELVGSRSIQFRSIEGEKD